MIVIVLEHVLSLFGPNFGTFLTHHSFFPHSGTCKMRRPSERQLLLTSLFCFSLASLLCSLSHLFDIYVHDRQVRPDQANGTMEPARDDEAGVPIRHVRRGLEGLVPDPALFSLLAGVAPTQLGNTPAKGPWMGGGHTSSVTATSPVTMTVTMPAPVTVTTTITNCDTHCNTVYAQNVPARHGQDSSILATNLGHVAPVPARPTTQPSAFGWSFAGCWADQPHQRVLAAFPATDLESVTNEVCVRHCFVHGYTLAATSFGKNCYCGQFLNGTQKLDSQCRTPCLGDKTEICGGDWALSCYSPDGQARGWAQFGEQPLPDILDPPIVKSLAAGAVDFTVVTSVRRAFPAPGADPSSLLSQYGHATQHPKATLPSGVGQSTACVGSGDGAGSGCTSDNGGAVTTPDMASNPTVTLRPGSLVSPERITGARGFPPK